MTFGEKVGKPTVIGQGQITTGLEIHQPAVLCSGWHWGVIEGFQSGSISVKIIFMAVQPNRSEW